MRATADTVIFDMGGVLASNGRPADITRRFPDHDPDVVLRVLMGDYASDGDHPWHRLERGEISFDENRRLNALALAEAGIAAPTAPPTADGAPPPQLRFEPSVPMVNLVHELRAHGVKLGVLTNNVREFRSLWWAMLPFDELFDDVVDSHEVGLRKPDPAIYQLALDRLGAAAARTVFLDDVRSNVDAATRMGMTGVLVDEDPTSAIEIVRRATGLTI